MLTQLCQLHKQQQLRVLSLLSLHSLSSHRDDLGALITIELRVIVGYTVSSDRQEWTTASSKQLQTAVAGRQRALTDSSQRQRAVTDRRSNMQATVPSS